jgi:hypothetical protein
MTATPLAMRLHEWAGYPSPEATSIIAACADGGG